MPKKRLRFENIKKHKRIDVLYDDLEFGTLNCGYIKYGQEGGIYFTAVEGRCYGVIHIKEILSEMRRLKKE